MLTDAEIAGYMGWSGPGAYTKSSMRKIKAAIAEAVKREREACAKLCADLPAPIGTKSFREYEGAAQDCADAILARSNAKVTGAAASSPRPVD